MFTYNPSITTSLEIVSFKYGNGPNTITLNNIRNALLHINTINISYNTNFNETFGDPCPGTSKCVYINCLTNNKMYKYEIPETHNGFHINANNMRSTYLKKVVLPNTTLNNQIQPNNYLAILAQFKNESHILKEWIDHYLWLGANKIFLIDNDSNDDFKDILLPYISSGHVELFFIPEKYQQTQNYNLIYEQKIKNKFTWLLVVDLDEFIYCPNNNLIQILTVFDSIKYINQLLINWLMFGSSGYIEQPQSVRKSFVHREKKKHILTKYFVKCNHIYSRWISSLWVHEAITHNGLKITMSQKNIRLNHYPIQSLNFFINVKMLRGDSANEKNDHIRNIAYFKTYDHKEVVDEILKNLIINNQLFIE